MGKSRRSLTVLGVAGALILAASGCSDIDAPDPTPSDPPTRSSSPTSTSTPQPPSPSPTASSALPAGISAGFEMPDCLQLLPSDQLRQTYGDRTELFDDGWFDIELPGPAAREAAGSATRSQSCHWGFPNSDGGAAALIAELAPATRTDLVDALRVAGTFTETATGDLLMFSRLEQNEVAGGGLAYVFDGAGWVAVTGTLVDEQQAMAAAARIMDGLRGGTF